MTTLLRLLSTVVLATLLIACGLLVSNSGVAPVPPPPAETLRVATHNVHYIRLRETTGAWSVDDWERRKGALDAALGVIGADVIAFQEMESFAGGNDGSVNLALDYLLDRNPGYSAGAVGDWRSFPSTQPILFRHDRLRLLEQGWFFFSDTPDDIYSRTFNGSYPAFASWARLAPDGGPEFRVVNVHLDYNSRSNRRLSAELIRQRIAPWIANAEPVILVGDLNATARSTVVDMLAAAGLEFAPVRGATYHFDRGLNLFGAIDHIAMTADTRVVGEPVVLRQKFDGHWPSDHYPVFVDLAFGREQ